MYAMIQSIEEVTIADLHAAYRSRAASAVDVTRAYLERVEAYDRRGPYLNSLITVNPNALHEAARLDAVLQSTGDLVGPLHGIPVILKDNLADLPMGLYDNINSVLPGFTRNPYNLAYASGGSSGLGAKRRVCRRKGLRVQRRRIPGRQCDLHQSGLHQQ